MVLIGVSPTANDIEHLFCVYLPSVDPLCEADDFQPLPRSSALPFETWVVCLLVALEWRSEYSDASLSSDV